MNTLDLIARLRAFEAGRPLPRGASIPSPRVAKEGTRILNFVRMGGEHLPWGFSFGMPGEEPQVVSIPEPRNQDRAAWLTLELGRVLDGHLGHPLAPAESDVHPSQRRLVFANGSHLGLLHQLGLRWRYAAKGDADHVAALRRAGRGALWTFHEHRRPGQLRVIDAASLLTETFVFPEQPIRLAHLGYALALLETPGSWAARYAAAAVAEARSVGATMDPEVENDELEPLVERYRAADSSSAESIATEIDAILRRELLRRHELTARSIAFLDADPRPENGALDGLRARALESWTYGYCKPEQRIADELASGGEGRAPDLDTDRGAARAASRYFDHEDSASLLEAALLLGDQERIEHAIAEGSALRGTVVAVVDEGPKPSVKRPVWTVEHDATLPLRLREGSRVTLMGERVEATIRRVLVDAAMRRRLEVRVTSGYRVAVRVAVGDEVVLAAMPAVGLAKNKSRRVWDGEGPGAWLTHSAPQPRPAADASAPDDLIALVEGLAGE